MVFRLIFWIIVMVIQLLLPDSRIRSAYPNRRYNPYFGVFEDDFEGGMSVNGTQTNTFSDSVRQWLRRRNALKACKKYLTKEKYILTLKNKHVILIMDTNNKTLTCLDCKVRNRTTTVIWNEHPVSQLERNDNEFERIFDSLCISFNDSANYAGISQVLKDNFTIHETNPAPIVTPSQKPSEEDKPIQLTSKYVKIVDINSADEKDISRLPGINIITAKRIIKYREEQGEIKDIEELCREFKIKEHFKKQIEAQVIFKAVGEKKNKKSNKERIIDF